MTVNESRFNMWRSLFAMAHADHEVSGEEKSFLYRILAEQPFTADQRRILEDDIEHRQDIGDLFAKVTDQQDRSQFFYYARALVWADGDFDEQEQRIMTILRQAHFNSSDLDQMSSLDLSIDEDEKHAIRKQRIFIETGVEKTGFFSRLMSLFDR